MTSIINLPQSNIILLSDIIRLSMNRIVGVIQRFVDNRLGFPSNRSPFSFVEPIGGYSHCPPSGSLYKMRVLLKTSLLSCSLRRGGSPSLFWNSRERFFIYISCRGTPAAYVDVAPWNAFPLCPCHRPWVLLSGPMCTVSGNLSLSHSWLGLFPKLSQSVLSIGRGQALLECILCYSLGWVLYIDPSNAFRSHLKCVCMFVKQVVFTGHRLLSIEEVKKILTNRIRVYLIHT